jgi:WD40 repeat protein
LTLEYTIHTIASIGHIKWRPQRRYHIASCALVVDCSINIWDVRRPYIPFAAFNEHKDIPSGVAWKEDPHVFLSSGRDCTLYQHTFDYASRPASKANPQGVSLNNKGEILYAHKINVNNAIVKAAVGIIR